MRWPFVSRARYDDLLERYQELRAHSNSLIEMTIKAPEKPAAEAEPEQPTSSLPSRPLGREIVNMATQAAKQKAIARGPKTK